MKRALAGYALLALLLGGVAALHIDLTRYLEDERFPFRTYFLPSKEQMKVLSLGYRSFWADLIFIWSIQYYDYYKRDVRYEYLEHTFDVLTDLDPPHQEAYLLGALFAFLGPRYDVLYRIEDKGIALNLENYIIPYDAGTYALFSEKNYPRAVKYFKTAVERSPERAMLRRLLGSALKSQGDIEGAMTYWKDIIRQYEGQDTPEAHYHIGKAAWRLWDAHVELDQRRVVEARNAYVTKLGSPPPSLRALVRAGLLPKIPLDPTGQQYSYNADTGKITCLTPFDVKKVIGKW